MHRIDTPGSAAGLFRRGNPFLGDQGTILSSAWLTALQEEYAYVIEQEGIVLDKLDDTQLAAAAELLVLGVATTEIGFQETLEAPYTVLEGEGMLVEETFGVATADQTIGLDVVVDLFGVRSLAKETGVGTAFTPGGIVFWDDATRAVQPTFSGGVATIGYAAVAAADGDATLLVHLNGATRRIA